MLPPSLSYMAEKLGQYETNTVKVFPQGDIQEYVEGQIMEFVLPSNCLVDLDSLFVSFSAGIDDASSGVGRLPADIHSLIDRITIKMGSLTIDDGAHGWSVFKRKYDKLTGKTVGALSHPEIVRSALTNTVSSSNVTDAPAPSQQETIIVSGSDYIWDSFDKTFLGTCEPRILDTSILPEINIQFHLKRNVCPSGVVVTSVAGFAPKTIASVTDRPTYVIADPSLKVNCISFGNAIYDDALSAQMRSGPIVMPFKKLYSYTDMAFSNMIDFNVATNSLDKIHFQPSDQKYKSGHWSVAREATNNCEVGNAGALSASAKYGLLELSEKYVDPSYASSYVGKRNESSAYNVTYQTSINNTLNPQFKADVTETYEITRAAVSEDMVPGHRQMFAEWFNDHCHGVVRFNRPGSTVRTPSGLNTQNSSAHMTLIADNIPQECQMDVFAETTAMLYAFAGQAVSLQN